MYDFDACKNHQDKDCKICARYDVVVEAFPDKKHTTSFWVGQDLEMEWGPMGMSECVTLKFIPMSASAPVIDDHYPDASYEMRRGWEAAVRILGTTQ